MAYNVIQRRFSDMLQNVRKPLDNLALSALFMTKAPFWMCQKGSFLYLGLKKLHQNAPGEILTVNHIVTTPCSKFISASLSSVT